MASTHGLLSLNLLRTAQPKQLKQGRWGGGCLTLLGHSSSLKSRQEAGSEETTGHPLWARSSSQDNLLQTFPLANLIWEILQSSIFLTSLYDIDKNN